LSAKSDSQFALVGKAFSLFLLRMNVSDIDLLQYQSMLCGPWLLSSVFFLKHDLSETGLFSVTRYEGSYLVEPEVETSRFYGVQLSTNFVPDNKGRSCFQQVVSKKPYHVDSVQNNTDFRFIYSGVGGVKRGRRVCLVGLLVIFPQTLLGIRENLDSRNVLRIYSRFS
jgi:hypothetical protein